MPAQVALATKNAAGTAIAPTAEGASKGIAEWRELNATYGSAADTVYTLEVNDKADGKSPYRAKFIVRMPILDATGVVTGQGSFMGSMIAPANAGEPFLQGLFNRGVNALLDTNVEQCYTDRKKIT